MTHSNPSSTRLDNSFIPALILFCSLALLLLILMPPGSQSAVSDLDAAATAQFAAAMAAQTAVAQIIPLAPESVQSGRWQWQQFTTTAVEHPPVQLWFDVVEGGGVSGILSIYPNASDIPPEALTLVQQNGCNVGFAALNTTPITGVFASATEAFVQVDVAECTIKYFGPYNLPQPISGQFAVAYDDALTQFLLNPAEPTPIERGRRVFAMYCSACHGSYAEGAPGIPALNTDQVRGYTDEQVQTIIREGVINTVMPAWGSVLSAEDIQGVFELVRNIEILESGG